MDHPERDGAPAAGRRPPARSGSGGRRRARKQSTAVRREQIAAAVLAITAEKGLGGLDVAGIARRVGTAPSALYRHFAAKEDAVDAALRLVGARLLANVFEVRAESPDALDRLERLLRRHLRLLRDHPGIPLVVFSGDVLAGDPRRRERVWEFVEKYLRGVAGIFRQGQEEGGIRRDIQPSVGAAMFLGIVQPAAILGVLSAGKLDVFRQAEAAWEVLRCAIAAGRGSRAEKGDRPAKDAHAPSPGPGGRRSAPRRH